MSLLRAAPTNPILSTTRSAPLTSHPLVNGFLKEGADRRRNHDVVRAFAASELPAALCSARAREIAATAQRMVRQKDCLIPLPKENAVPILEDAPKPVIFSASIRLTDSTAAQVDQYAAFIHASADDVVEQALAYVFGKDRRLSGVPEVAEAQRITPTLGRAPWRWVNDASEQPARKPVSSASLPAQAPAIVAGSKA